MKGLFLQNVGSGLKEPPEGTELSLEAKDHPPTVELSRAVQPFWVLEFGLGTLTLNPKP